MKHHVLCTTGIVVLSVIATTAGAVPYWRLVPATPTGYVDDCNFVDDDATLLCNVAVVMEGSGDYLGVGGFKVFLYDVSWTPLSIASDYPLIGTPGGDIFVDFASCLSPPVKVVTITYLCPGTSPCGRLVLGVGSQGSADLALCDSTLGPAYPGAQMTVNGVNDVPPGGYDPDCYCPAASPAEPSTWGRIKALFRD